jgi:SPP1 gp7 family putative phage head morphogenesis protein
MTPAQAFAALRRLTPVEAVDYLQQRGSITQTYNWSALWQEEHARQFTVSRLTNVDLLTDMQRMITESVDGNLSRKDFMRNAETALKQAGWWGTSEVIDPSTGEIVKTKFDAARLKLIYDTNTRMAYAAGQWERIEATKRTHPYLRYVTAGDEKVRASHRMWAHVTLPVDDAFWTTHFPPNGWRCRCRVTQVSRREYERGMTPTGAAMKKEAPKVEMRDWYDKASGKTRKVPVGIDPGFGYNPGASKRRASGLGDLISRKLDALPKLPKGTLPSPGQLGAMDYMAEVIAGGGSGRGDSFVFDEKDFKAAMGGKQMELDLGATQLRVSSEKALELMSAPLDGDQALPVMAYDLGRLPALLAKGEIEAEGSGADGEKMVTFKAVEAGMEYRIVMSAKSGELFPQAMTKRRLK